MALRTSRVLDARFGVVCAPRKSTRSRFLATAIIPPRRRRNK
jgi:hypothetical protein